MRRKRCFIAGLAVWLSVAATAEGAGICFEAAGRNYVVVKRYSKPTRGSCKTFAGWEAHSGGVPVYGTACLNSAGDRLQVGYTIANQGSQQLPISVWMSLPYPSLAGGQASTRYENDTGWYLDGAAAFVCGELFAPVP